MSGTKEDLVAYRIERAYKTLGTAKLVAESGDWNAVANRLYYACFCAGVTGPKRHGYLHAQRRENYVESALHQVWIGGHRLGKLYQKLFDNRNEADYENFIDFDEETIGVFIEDAERFITVITTLANR